MTGGDGRLVTGITLLGKYATPQYARQAKRERTASLGEIIRSSTYWGERQDKLICSARA